MKRGNTDYQYWKDKLGKEKGPEKSEPILAGEHIPFSPKIKDTKICTIDLSRAPSLAKYLIFKGLKEYHEWRDGK